MAGNVTVQDPVAVVAERALKKTSVTKVTGWSTTKQRFVFVAPYDCKVSQVYIVSDTAVAGDDTNYYAFQVQNLTQEESLLSAAKTTQATGGAEIVADTPYALTPDQNTVLADGDVLELQVTATGAPTSPSNAEVIVAVEYT